MLARKTRARGVGEHAADDGAQGILDEDAVVRFVADDPGSAFVIEFLEVTIAGTPRPTEHALVAWVATTALGKLALCPSDAAFVAALLAGTAAPRP